MLNVVAQCEASVRDRGIAFGARIGEDPTLRMDPQILDLSEYTEVQYLRLVAQGRKKGFKMWSYPEFYKSKGHF